LGSLKRKTLLAISALLIIFICIYILITLYSMQKPEIISHSEEVYWGDLGSASPTTALYGLYRAVVRSGKSCTCNLTVRWYLNGELVAERRTTFSLYAAQERHVNLFVILSCNQTDMDLPYECQYEIVES